ncbi:cytochrome-c oxidase, cbb3-type subunit III [Oricola nitratireducens]|jgi:cytochrome c oxidase cbb3-type subunit 3|uniref:cytochrome-c oxidase, cbb3-type subunit III n=1 Tax=Oricola nitratireducens TaxID=2775868 RepID=UPI001865F2F9|nr:cytochrome-c oxidase, cbb3-type subunit III [Oricola nitratireducens]
MADKKEIDEVSGVETTGHEWDGIKELNNPLPRWWLWTFYACIIWALAYTVFYPAWPGITGATAGILGWSSRGDLAKEVETAKAAQAVYLDKLAATDITQVSADPELVQFASAGGASMFKVYCVQCHGSGAQGGPGYPNLNDDSWIWGGTIEDIYTTLMHGVRYAADEDTRISDMPAFGRDEILTREDINNVAWYVRKLSGQDYEETNAAAGETIFADNCAACHGDNGQGTPELGAPRLNDAIWLYGGTHADIVAQVTSPRQGVMPAWSGRLGETSVKQLAVYVHGLGGGQ